MKESLRGRRIVEEGNEMEFTSAQNVNFTSGKREFNTPFDPFSLRVCRQRS